MIARTAYEDIKAQNPNINVQYMDPDSMFTNDKPGWNKQKAWYEKMEKDGWEVIEIHMDASMQSGEGSGRGIIVPHYELNSVEAYFAKTFGAYDRRHRSPTDDRNHPDEKKQPLAAPSRGVSMIEAGNMSAELEKLLKEGKITKETIRVFSNPITQSFLAALGTQQFSPPSQRQPTQPGYLLRQGGDKNQDTQFVIIPTSSAAGKTIAKNATVEGQRFIYDASFGGYRTQNEVSSSTRTLLLRRLGLN
jgi:hypothetical protein